VTELFELLVNGLSLGGTYALLALGLAVIFAILGLINFSHGELITITGYTMYFMALTRIPWIFILVSAILVAAIAALLLERVAFRPLRNASPTSGLMTTFAVMMILQVAWSNFISPLRRTVIIPEFLGGTTSLGQASIGNIQIMAIVASAISLAGVTVFLKRTDLGIALRAAATNFTVTRLMGIRADRVIAMAFFLSGLLAGIAGVLWIGQRAMVYPYVGIPPVLKAFIAVVFGGLDSLAGAAAGGLILGFVEVVLRTYLPHALLPYREALELSVVVLVLLRWPSGLLSIYKSVCASSKQTA
jgi:branched-chain amino acid transport system permease protein